MLLHNQVNKPLHWEADGVGYDWEPYGSCDVPERWLQNLKSQGFPVAATPMTIERRAENLATEQREAESRSELNKLREKLADAEARAAAAGKEAESAKAREDKAKEALADEKAKRKTLEEQLVVSKNEVAEYEKLCAEESQKREAAEKQLGTLKARAEVEKPAKK